MCKPPITSQPQSKQCFTIGYGNSPIDRFITFVQTVGIGLIIDVRSSPYSRFNPHFNRENLEKSLINNYVDYQFMGDKIGGRYSNPNLLFPDGTVNYRKVQETEKFQDGINEVVSIISSGKKIALMCAEKETERCHRFALSHRFYKRREFLLFISGRKGSCSRMRNWSGSWSNRLVIVSRQRLLMIRLIRLRLCMKI